jgi:hypothetical protein
MKYEFDTGVTWCFGPFMIKCENDDNDRSVHVWLSKLGLYARRRSDEKKENCWSKKRWVFALNRLRSDGTYSGDGPSFEI